MIIKKNICTISYFDVNQKNGGAIFAKNLDFFLNQSQTFVSTVFCSDKSPTNTNASHTNTSSNIKEKSYKTSLKNSLKNNKTFELFIHFLRNDLNALMLVLKLFFQKKIQKNAIILCHDHLSLFYFSLFYSLKKYKVAMIMHNDGSPVEMVSSGITSNRKKNILNKITNYQINSILPNTNKIIFLCDAARDKFINLYNVALTNTATIPNGIKPDFETTKNKPENTVIKFITVCTMNERKGIDTFINCLPIINEKYKNKVSFTLLGQGPLLGDLKNLALNHNNLNVVGESNNVAEYLNNSDVFFLLSTTEGQPLSILEALRASLFIFATDVGCNAAMVKKQNGLLVPVNHDSILDGFMHIIDFWENFKNNGLISHQLFKNEFTEDKMFQSYIQIFNDLSK